MYHPDDDLNILRLYEMVYIKVYGIKYFISHESNYLTGRYSGFHSCVLAATVEHSRSVA